MSRNTIDFKKIIQNIEHNEGEEDDGKKSDIFEDMRSFVINPRNSVILVPYLSERVPTSTSSEKLEEVIDIVCEKVFNPPTERGVNVTAYAAFCKGFADLKVTKEIKGFKRVMTFEEILADTMVNKLEERFSYKYRLLEQMKIRPGPEENKQRWLENQTEKQKRKLRNTARTTIQFIKEVHTTNSESVYKVMDYLLANADEERLEYLCLLLKAMGRDLDAEIARKRRIQSPTARHFLNDDRIKLNTIFRKVSLLAMGNPSIPTCLRTMMQDIIKLRQVGWKAASEDTTSLESVDGTINSSMRSIN